MNLRSLSLISLLLLLTSQTFAQCSMKGEYGEIFDLEVIKSEKSDKPFLIKRIGQVDEDKCYAEAVNAMPEYFDYLKTNFSNHDLYGSINLTADEKSVRKEFETALDQDSKLTSLIDEYFFKVNGQLEKEKILFEEVRDIATKFFVVKEIDEKDRYHGKVCVGVNLLEKTLPKRRALVEAFVFAALMSDLKSEDSELMRSFKASLKELYNNNLGLDKEERLLRAQGMMMAMMKNDAKLNGILATYYASNIKNLPFEIQMVN